MVEERACPADVGLQVVRRARLERLDRRVRLGQRAFPLAGVVVEHGQAETGETQYAFVAEAFGYSHGLLAQLGVAADVASLRVHESKVVVGGRGQMLGRLQ